MPPRVGHPWIWRTGVNKLYCGQEIRRDVFQDASGSIRSKSLYMHTLPAPLTDWHWRWPLSVVPTNQLGLTVQHVVRFAADGHVFAGPVRVLRDGRVTVRRVPWPGTSDRYNISITLRARDQKGVVGGGSGYDGGEGISFSKSLSTRKNAIASPLIVL